VVKKYIKGSGSWIAGEGWQQVDTIKSTRGSRSDGKCQVREVACFHTTEKGLEREWLSYQ